MSVLEGVLREELDRQERLVAFYKSKLESLPRGSIFVLKKGRSSYVYRKVKINGKVVSEYLGLLNSQECNIEIQKSEEYKRTKQNLKEALIELSILKEAIKLYDRKRRTSSNNS